LDPHKVSSNAAGDGPIVVEQAGSAAVGSFTPVGSQ
jgi:hypothetical protein